MEDAYSQSLRLLLEQEGDLDLVIEMGREMMDRVSRLEIDLAMPEGYRGLYYLVYGLFETGEYKEALKKAMDGAKACGNRILGNKFKSIIEKIVREIDESLLNPDIISQVATAKYNKGQYNECITFAKKGLGSLQTTQDKGKFGLKLFCLMGKCYVAMERRIEATYAYGEGCEIFNDFRPGDSKYADALEMASIRCKNNADKVFRNSKRAPSMKPLLEYGSRIYKAHTKDPGRIIIGEMKTLLGAKKYSSVITKFKELKTEYSSYEQGLAILVEVEYEKAKKSGSFRSVKQKAKNYPL